MAIRHILLQQYHYVSEIKEELNERISRPTLLMLDTLKQTCIVIITIHNVDLEVLPKDKSKEAVGDTHPMELNMVCGNAEDFG